MFKFNELNQLHLEITNNCQASCPMCVRNVHGGLENPLVKIENWSLERYKTIVNEEVLQQIRLIQFCGNYGDPLLNNDLLKMTEYTAQVNPDVHIRIHTNGSMRNKEWWAQLAKTLPINHSVIFALDGLEDTHHLYRIGTDFNKIIENAKEFIANGGTAEWAYLRFKHNEHQSEEAKKLASELGFHMFTMKDSARWVLDEKFPVYDKNKNITHYIEPSQWSQMKFIRREVLENYKQILENTEIDCYALKIKEVYITAQGLVFPCCWLGVIPYQTYNHEQELVHIRKEILDQYNDLVESLGGEDSINSEKRSIKDIINSEEYQTVWNHYWTKDKLITCVRSCGKIPEIISKPNDQFITNENLSNEPI
jgi:MoaA/NifB/PqqE/SkfB family radical SAM enzyme